MAQRAADQSRQAVLVRAADHQARLAAVLRRCRGAARAPVSTPVEWSEVEHGIAIDDFRLDNVRARLAERGDLWAPLLARDKRVDLAARL
ncbi:MAG: hypothetical protein ABI629_15125 [bacterium]